MSGNNKVCSSCKKNIDINDFLYESKTYSTCITCRNRKSEKRRKNICEDCGIRANFNYENIKFGIRCSKHKEIGMIDIKHKKCQYTDCKKRPTFNIEGEICPRFCADHKEIRMINLVDKTCEYCKKIPIYNIEGELKGRFCKDHKEIGMINVKNKKSK